METTKHQWTAEPVYVGDDRYAGIDIVTDHNYPGDVNPVVISFGCGSVAMDKQIAERIVRAVNDTPDLVAEIGRLAKIEGELSMEIQRLRAALAKATEVQQ